VAFLGWVGAKLPNYEMGRYEVTNAQFQTFVDQGGYQKPQYWKEKFIQDGKQLTFAQAMAQFRDRSGRLGPSTWDAGHYPPGQDNFPVTGVSWYEAAAYANFAAQDLPVLAQFYNAALEDAAFYSSNAGNFAGHGPVSVGSALDVGPFGTYDMAGNVREWSRTATGDQRFILGGAWGTQPYQAADPESLPPFDRSPMNGLRTVLNRTPLPAQALAPLTPHVRDFASAQPASDAVFDAYKAMYAYEPVPLLPQPDGPLEDTPSWTKQRFTIDAGHDGARLPLYLFLPKQVAPPYQAVVFFPSARVEIMTDSHQLGDMQFVDYVIKSGRALIYPIYLGTYERPVNPIFDVGAIGDLQMTIQRSKEVRRAFDYLSSRPDIDTTKVAYLGVSMGSAYGLIFTSIEPRFRTAIFLDGGFFQGAAAKGRDLVDFAPRVKIPVLMVNGKYDFTFPPDSSQAPMFRLLGTDPADKKHVLLDSPHDVSQQKAALSQAVLAWLDKYLGPIN
ncbi:MAG: SUMF1/EgtB/PvdO family nonheme iron enzyme, partial [Terriglobales bacterium]